MEIIGPEAQSYCDGLVAYGVRDYGLQFIGYGDVGGESVPCEFQGKDHVWRVWHEPEWEAGSEFCSFLGQLLDLP